MHKQSERNIGKECSKNVTTIHINEKRDQCINTHTIRNKEKALKAKGIEWWKDCTLSACRSAQAKVDTMATHVQTEQSEGDQCTQLTSYKSIKLLRWRCRKILKRGPSAIIYCQAHTHIVVWVWIIAMFTSNSEACQVAGNIHKEVHRGVTLSTISLSCGCSD